MHVDLAIRGGRIVDGTGGSAYRGDVGIRDDRICYAGPPAGFNARRTIDAEGMVVSPGFIDMHSHSDLMIFVEPEASSKVMQGVTTEVLGQDGQSVAPIKDEHKRDWRRRLSGLLGDPELPWKWNTFDEYLSALQKAKPTTNLVSLVPHGSIRLWVMGMEDRAPTSSEMDAMKGLLRESLEAGAVGMSAGLIYPPCPYADVEELAGLCGVLADHRKLFVVHIRNEEAGVMEALDEMIEVARKSGAPVHISHLKAAGKSQRGRADELLSRIDAAREEGLDITFDQYPYTAGSTMLFALLPQWLQEGGSGRMLERLRDADVRRRIMEELASRTESSEIPITDVRVSAVKSEKNKHLEGKNLFELAEAMERPFVDAVCELLVEEDLNVSMIIFLSDEQDVRTILRHPAQTACTDGLLGGKPHPRAYGTFPRILGRMCRDERALPLAEAIRKMTSAGALRLGLPDRGLVKEGFRADLVVFDPRTILDTATYEEPRRFPVGIEHVFINGKHVVDSGTQVGAKSGRVIRLS